MKQTTAAAHKLIGCESCGLVNLRVRTIEQQRCTRCGAPLHLRRPDSVARSWALLLAAMILYIPANVLPIMHTQSLFGAQDDTIMSGILLFWNTGSYLIAMIIFVASFMVPMLKLGAMALLLITTQRRSAWRLRQRARLYRILEGIGRWSMLDVFVVTLTIALVRFNNLAVITPGPGAVAFGAVVVLTMLSTQQFDPRLMWDAVPPDYTDDE
ncbi:paraquat-inducible protein A [Chitinasiproducens palmae]|uniref:Paraquat-inducible protein A n=1 Tax=Chitinasiproducens palmae TaxID=1770053 RepID=A0A1H2PRG1_9BURK|nr:paraquat-inducible protein A [Chitinasiproducens palmae]SDV49503.1 paraquat-inducible protein A [Chitinasiproducens palmae]